MERPLTMKPLSIQDENSAITRKKPPVEGKSKNSKPVAKKGGVALEGRKALNDITNKKSTRTEASSQNKGSQNQKCNIVNEGQKQHNILEAEALSKRKGSLFEKLNIAEEGFLHDHSKCDQAQKSALPLELFLDIVLPGHDSADVIAERTESKPNASQELKELSMSEFSHSWYKSPPSSPIRWGFPTASLFAWNLEPVELVLKEGNSRDV